MTLTQKRLLLITLCSLLLPAMAYAQVTTADLVGTVRDTSGAIVPGVTVVLTNEATGVSRTVTTGPAGTYIFTTLQPGRYRLNAEIQGFRKVERTGVDIAGQSTRRDRPGARGGPDQRDRDDRGPGADARDAIVGARHRD